MFFSLERGPLYGFPDVSIGRKIKHPGRLLNVLCTFNLRPVSTGVIRNL